MLLSRRVRSVRPAPFSRFQPSSMISASTAGSPSPMASAPNWCSSL